MPVPNWARDEAWDICLLGRIRLPGVCTVNVSMDSGLDVKKPKGSRKARVVDEGVHPAKVEIKVRLQPDELEEFEREIVPMLRPRGSDAARDPLEITHPNAYLWGVNAVMIADIGSPSPASGNTMDIAINAIEWRPPTAVKKSKTKPKGDDDEGGVEPEIAALQESAASRASAGFESPEALQSLEPDFE